MAQEFPRLLDLHTHLKTKSHFLLGPRATGKSSWIRKTLLPEYQYLNLLDPDVKLQFLQRPGLLKSWIKPKQYAGVVIDEVQKIPELLDVVHDLIESQKIRFLLTGSSARKLKRGGTNLLAGRARTLEFYPLVSAEITDFDLERALLYGTLPAIYTSDSPWEDLRAYVDTYLKEEIQEETAIRNLGGFSRFLTTAALQSGELLNYAGVASDAQVPEGTVRNHYQLLHDTLLGSLLEPWRESKKRKAIQTAKFYLFDVGVTHALLERRELTAKSPEFGRAFEAWMLNEIRAWNSYQRHLYPIRYWRSVSNQEVDFCVGDRMAIEVKAKTNVSARDHRGLQALREEKAFKRHILVSLDPVDRKEDGIEFMHWESFLAELWK